MSKKSQINKPTNKNSLLDALEQQKNLEIDLLKKDKEQINIQLMNANNVIKQLQCELNEANNKLASKNNTSSIK